MSRRLPIYLVLDTSGSMDGAPINAVNQGLQVFQAALRSDPRALETAFVSLITFDSQATQVVPLTDISSFTPPTLRASGTTAFGAALQLLEQCISREVVRTAGEGQKGDWKPLVFLMTDGQPTDSWEPAASSLRGKGVNIIACAAGDGADEQMLKNLTPTVIKLSDTNEQQVAAFFKWVTASAKQASVQVGTSGADQGIALPPPPPNAGIVIVP
jgi:uncharacterized protein YegL